MTTRAKLIRDGEAFFKSVLHANEDLAVRLRGLSISITYDRDDDTFMLTLGDHREALTESVDESRLYIRIDPDTLKIVGVEIPELTVRLGDDPVVKRIWLAARNLPGPCLAADSAAADAVERLAHELRELVAA